MISMKVRNKDRFNLLHFKSHLANTRLGSLSAIDEERMLMYRNKLGCGRKTLSWRRCSTAQYGNVEVQLVLNQ
jgi:hypothetical protein